MAHKTQATRKRSQKSAPPGYIEAPELKEEEESEAPLQKKQITKRKGAGKPSTRHDLEMLENLFCFNKKHDIVSADVKTDVDIHVPVSRIEMQINGSKELFRSN